MIKSALGVVTALVFYALADIMLWQRIFESHKLDYYAYLYHPGWYVMLVGEIVLGGLLLIPNWRAVIFYMGALPLLATSGMEDVLYYWLDSRPIPFLLPWLNINPVILFKPVTSANLLLSVSIWVAICLVAFVLLCRLGSAPRKASPTLAHLSDKVVAPVRVAQELSLSSERLVTEKIEQEA